MGRPEKPLNSVNGALTAFAKELRELRQRAGNPSYRELARVALFSPSALSQAASGRHLPTLQVTLAFVDACGGDRVEWERKWRALAGLTSSAEQLRAQFVPTQWQPRRYESARYDLARYDPVAGQYNARHNDQHDDRGYPVESAAVLAFPRPAHLPIGPLVFVGRDDELALAGGARHCRAPATTQPMLITGPVGVGKTALALQIAKRLAGELVDGALYADLGGDAAPSTFDVLGGFLTALGVDGRRLPNDLDQRIGLYRSMLRHRRLLVLLDDASDERQVRPLLADAASSRILVTSCGRLAGLDGVRRVALDVLTARQSIALVESLLSDRTRDGVVDVALEELVRLCDRLPLALNIVARGIGVHPGWTVEYTASRLRDPATRIGRIQVGDTKLITRLDARFGRLSQQARWVCGRLAEANGRDIVAASIASTMDIPAERADAVLDELVDSGFVQPTDMTGRYRMLELFRLYAAAAIKAGDTEL
ncbi:MAG: helix-turn-helix domain-containing protein, partial [Sciscionella sp.]|nr:helix-turn-helix domain-containing protein [Sciscionella sp.]